MLIKKHIQEKFSYIDVKEILDVVRNYREEVDNFEIVIHYFHSHVTLSRIYTKLAGDPRYYIIAIFRILMRNDLIKVFGVEVRSCSEYSIWGKTIFSKFYKETC